MPCGQNKNKKEKQYYNKFIMKTLQMVYKIKDMDEEGLLSPAGNILML